MAFLNWLKTVFKRYFLLGIFVLLPFYVTVRFFIFIIEYFDGILKVNNGRWLFVIPQQFHPDALIGRHIPGLGTILCVLFIVLVGISSRNFFGNWLIKLGGKLVDQIPFARTIFKVVKDVLQSFSNLSSYDKFSNVVLIEYPRKGLFTMVFVTGKEQKIISKHTGKEMVNVFVPTTPNPTSGYLLFVPVEETIEIDISIEDAFKLIVSGGMVNPQD